VKNTLINFDAADMRKIGKNRDRIERFNSQHGGYRNAIFGGVKNRALDGSALKFNTPFPFPNKNRLVMFEPDCFGDLDQRTVAFCVDHELANEIATTDNGLTLIVDNDALQFRLDLEKATNGYVIAHLCEIGNREAMSVHCDIVESRTKTIAGRTVQVVSRARLIELSLCRNGAAGDDAFAMLVDTAVTPKPTASSRSAKFHTYNAIYKISRKVRELKASKASVLALTERIAVLDDDEAPPFVWAAMTSDQINRQTTERYDQLQANALRRLRHC
jgi:Caudovirus prohead serine protease